MLSGSRTNASGRWAVAPKTQAYAVAIGEGREQQLEQLAAIADGPRHRAVGEAQDERGEHERAGAVAQRPGADGRQERVAGLQPQRDGADERGGEGAAQGGEHERREVGRAAQPPGGERPAGLQVRQHRARDERLHDVGHPEDRTQRGGGARPDVERGGHGREHQGVERQPAAVAPGGGEPQEADGRCRPHQGQLRVLDPAGPAQHHGRAVHDGEAHRAQRARRRGGPATRRRPTGRGPAGRWTSCPTLGTTRRSLDRWWTKARAPGTVTRMTTLLPERASVVVVGGGVMGVSAAFHLAEAGVPDVLLLDAGAARRRLDVPGRGRRAGDVLRRGERRARPAQPRGVRRVRDASGPGDRPAPRRLPVPARPARARPGDDRRGGAAERARRPEPDDRSGGGPAPVAAHQHRRAARRRVVADRRALHPRVGGARLRLGGPSPRRAARPALRRHRRRRRGRRRDGGRHAARHGGDEHRRLRRGRVVAAGGGDGRRRAAGDPAAPAGRRHRARAGAAGVAADDDRLRDVVLLPRRGPRAAHGHERPRRASPASRPSAPTPGCRASPRRSPAAHPPSPTSASRAAGRGCTR